MPAILSVLGPGTWPALFRCFLAAVFAGFAIKIMDDWIDSDHLRDSAFLSLLGKGSLPYALALLALAASVDRAVACSVFLVSYAMGMAWTGACDRLPSGLQGWQESLVAVACSFVTTGVRTTATAGLVIAAVQGFDDVMDLRAGKEKTSHIASLFGSFETTVGSAALLALGVALNVVQAIGMAAAATVVWLVEIALERSHGSGRSPGDCDIICK